MKIDYLRLVFKPISPYPPPPRCTCSSFLGLSLLFHYILGDVSLFRRDVVHRVQIIVVASASQGRVFEAMLVTPPTNPASFTMRWETRGKGWSSLPGCFTIKSLLQSDGVGGRVGHEAPAARTERRTRPFAPGLFPLFPSPGVRIGDATISDITVVLLERGRCTKVALKHPAPASHPSQLLHVSPR